MDQKNRTFSPNQEAFPLPPNRIQGWPWDPPALTTTSTTGERFPKISVITPSYNQGQFLEKTIRSVLLQGYPNLEYIVIDGGSRDNSLEVIKKYSPWISYWVSEKDAGQAEAINKGLSAAEGEILTWLNSDDCYHPETVWSVARCFQDEEVDIVYGRCRMVAPDGSLLRLYDSSRTVSVKSLLRFWEEPFASPAQPTVFFRRDVIQRARLLDTRFHYALDYELWLRFAAGSKFHFCEDVWADYLIHETSKTHEGFGPFMDEIFIAAKPFLKRLNFTDRIHYALFARRMATAKIIIDEAYDAKKENNNSAFLKKALQAALLNPMLLTNIGFVKTIFQTAYQLL